VRQRSLQGEDFPKVYSVFRREGMSDRETECGGCDVAGEAVKGGMMEHFEGRLADQRGWLQPSGGLVMA
jgi:hypothetical protein